MNAKIDEAETEEVEVEETTVTQQDKSEKTFTQAEVDRLIQNRLRRVKEESKTSLDALTADVTFYEEQFEKVIEAQTVDWDDGMRELFNALPVRERLQKLSDEAFMGKVRRRAVPPKTPKSETDDDKPKKVIGFGHRV